MKFSGKHNICNVVHLRRNLGRVARQFNIREFLIIALKPNLEEVDVEVHRGVEGSSKVGETAREN